jgi:hypothetical protein
VADYNAAILVRGFAVNATPSAPAIRDGGCCVINCTNGNGADAAGSGGATAGHQIYSFHAGMANVVRCDGTVHSLSASTPAGIVAAMVSRNGGETFSD